MIKRFLFVVLLLISIIGVSGCFNTEKMGNLKVTTDKEEIKKENLKVTAGKQEIKYITLDNNGNGSLIDKSFKYAFEPNALQDIKYLKIGDKVSLDFGNNPPTDITITDRLLNLSGDQVYQDKLTIEVPFTKDNNKYYFYYFSVQNNMASRLSSYYRKTDFRGYKISAYWGKHQKEYAFVIKTDSFLSQKLRK